MQEIDIRDLENPRSVLNLLPEKIKERVQEISQKYPEYFNKSEGELFQLLNNNLTKIKAVDDLLRMKFWVEYDRVQAYQLKALNMSYILAGCVSKDFFYQSYFKDPGRVAWMLCPPVNYIARLEEIHINLLMQLSQMAREPVVDEFGNYNQKLGDQKIKLFQVIDQRLHGSVVQRHQIDQTVSQKTVQVNLSANEAKSFNSASENYGVEALESKLRDLEKESRTLSHLPGEPGATIEVQASQIVESASLDMTKTE